MGPNGAAEPALVPLERPAGRTQWTFSHGGRSYAVFADGDVFVVTDAACPHNGGPLAEGLVRDGWVTCPWHWYSYELATGRCRTAAGYELRRYPVVLVGGRPHAALPAAAAPRSWSQILRGHARSARAGGGAPPAGASGLRSLYPDWREAHVTARPGDQRAAARGRLRASHADREQVISALKAAYVQDRLTKDELDDRVGRALSSRTHAELASITADIPLDLARVRPERAPAQPGPRIRSGVRVTVTATLLAAVLWAAAIAAGSAAALAAAIAVTGVALLTSSVTGEQIREARHHRRSAAPLPPGAVPGSS